MTDVQPSPPRPSQDVAIALADAANDPNVEIIRESRRNPPQLPPLRASRGRTKLRFKIGVFLAIMDLAVLPIAYFYALEFGTSFNRQTEFGIITGIFAMICFLHYSFRSLRLFMHRTGIRYRPLGWERWGLAEFLHMTIASVIFLVEIELVVGTIPSTPIIRLCAMASATVCFYLGFLFVITSILAIQRRPLPFNLSSVPKGSPWRPALYPIIEDFGALEMSGERAFRRQLMLRYDASTQFRRMILVLTMSWGIFFLVVASGTTVAIMLLPEVIGFGVGWGMPYLCSAVAAFVTVIYVRKSLQYEREEWRRKCENQSVTSSERSVV